MMVPRDRVRAGAVECPLCRRQIAEPRSHLRSLSGGPETVAAADAIECPTCGGVTFLSPLPDE